MEINNPHDRGYKSLLASEEIFLQLLQSFVDMGWVSQIDPEAVTRIDTTQILPDFSEKEADLVYRLKIKGQEVIFYLLMELQSSVDFQMPYRLLTYMMGIWRDVLKNTGPKEVQRKEFRLPPIVPVVLYNSKERWTACRSFKEILAEAELFKEFVVDFKYILIDVNRYDKQNLKDLTNIIGTVFLLEQAKDVKEIMKDLLGIGPILRKFDAKSFQLFASWLKVILTARLPEKAKQEIIKILEESRPEEAEKMVTNIEKIIEEGLMAGKMEGILEGKMEDAKKMMTKNMPEDLIIEITGLSVEQIRKIKSEFH
ncbi:MAG: Rpn family recombination-promoting nuclease/putative transposase [Firmicutes bacterium]|nr:Rpn family recombination-promoting nuclease/putative transposase [Bacillota bacterium]